MFSHSGCMCSKRERGRGFCITWELKVAFHLFNAHVRRGGIDSPSGSVYPHSGCMCCKGGRGRGPAEHGTLKLFSSSLMPILVEAEYLTTGERF